MKWKRKRRLNKMVNIGKCLKEDCKFNNDQFCQSVFITVDIDGTCLMLKIISGEVREAE